jgi:hypothetical protein
LRFPFIISVVPRNTLSAVRANLSGKRIKPKVMSANATADTPTQDAANIQTQSAPQASVPKKITNAQTVCNVKNEKGKLCNGHLKQLQTGGEEAKVHLRGDDVLYKCQSCGTLYMGPPLGHLRDPLKQERFVELELSTLLQAAGGTLPAIVKNERGVFVLAEETAHHAPAAKPAAAKPAAAALSTATAEQTTTAAAKPATASGAQKSPSQTSLGPIPGADGPVPGETHEQKLARLRAVVAEAKRRKELFGGEAAPAAGQTRPAAASTSGMDSSPQADAHRPAAEAQAATGQASAAPLSPAAATASPVAGAETPADLAPDDVNEEKAPARRATPGGTLYRAAFDTGPVPGETHEQKIERLKLVVAAAKERSGKEG